MPSGARGARSALSRAASISAAACAARLPNGACYSRINTRATSPGTSSSATSATSPTMQLAMGRTIAKGAIRQGEVLLAGLLRCGHCGRKLQVHYSGKLGRYTCYGARMNHGTARCISLGNRSADAAVSSEVLRVLAPLGMDAAVKVLDTQTSETSATERQLKLALTQAQYEVAHARRQYDAVDPANRLVAGELERRWNAQ